MRDQSVDLFDNVKLFTSCAVLSFASFFSFSKAENLINISYLLNVN